MLVLQGPVLGTSVTINTSVTISKFHDICRVFCPNFYDLMTFVTSGDIFLNAKSTGDISWWQVTNHRLWSFFDSPSSPDVLIHLVPATSPPSRLRQSWLAGSWQACSEGLCGTKCASWCWRLWRDAPYALANVIAPFWISVPMRLVLWRLLLDFFFCFNCPVIDIPWFLCIIGVINMYPSWHVTIVTWRTSDVTPWQPSWKIHVLDHSHPHTPTFYIL